MDAGRPGGFIHFLKVSFLLLSLEENVSKIIHHYHLCFWRNSQIFKKIATPRVCFFEEVEACPLCWESALQGGAEWRHQPILSSPITPKKLLGHAVCSFLPPSLDAGVNLLPHLSIILATVRPDISGWKDSMTVMETSEGLRVRCESWHRESQGFFQNEMHRVSTKYEPVTG